MRQNHFFVTNVLQKKWHEVVNGLSGKINTCSVHTHVYVYSFLLSPIKISNKRFNQLWKGKGNLILQASSPTSFQTWLEVLLQHYGADDTVAVAIVVLHQAVKVTATQK